ncbi:MAG: hypothetical protein CM1200mP2_20190 [Planctomycetaceae bacterium]|nr:MAG: hypothetical protein CM1200mP2_20190 [Planctomycetaceae bacterium]
MKVITIGGTAGDDRADVGIKLNRKAIRPTAELGNLEHRQHHPIATPVTGLMTVLNAK